jgi:hypothetical protein
MRAAPIVQITHTIPQVKQNIFVKIWRYASTAAIRLQFALRLTFPYNWKRGNDGGWF